MLTNDGLVSLGRDLKRRISATVHYYLSGKLSNGDRLKLRGTLAYAKSVEPEFIVRLGAKYGTQNLERVIKST